MNWKTSGRVLIIAYSIVLAVFLSVFAYFCIDAYLAERESAKNTVAFLSEKEISLQEGTDISKTPKSHKFILKNIALSEKETIHTFLGADAVFVRNNEYKNDKAYFRITGSRILYEETRRIEPIENSVDIDEKVFDSLKRLGFDKNKCAVFDVSMKDGIISFEAVPKVGDYWVHGIGISAVCDKEGIVRLEGIWFVPEKGTEKIEFCDKKSALISLAHSGKAKGKTIENIYSCYYVTEDAAMQERVIPMPLYTVKCTDGSEYRFDAYSARLYTNR